MGFNKYFVFIELAIIFYVTTAIKPSMANHSNDLTQSNRTKLNEDDYSVYYQGSIVGVEGRPGVDFPVFSYIPRTGFSCKDMESGYYADLETNCQVFHICEEGKKISFLCPNGTIFQQQDLICEWWFKVNCTNSPNLYDSSAEQLREDNLKRKAFRKVKFNGDHNHGAVMRMEEASTVTATKNGKHFQVHVHQKQSKSKGTANLKAGTSFNRDVKRERLRVNGDQVNSVDATSFGTDNSVVSTENFSTNNGRFNNKYNGDSFTSSSTNRPVGSSITSKPYSTTYSTTSKSTTERFLINADNNDNQDDFPLHESEKQIYKSNDVRVKQKSTVPLTRNDITNRRLVDGSTSESEEAQIVQETASFVKNNNNNRNNIYSTSSTTAFPYPNHRSTYSDLKTPSTAFGSFANSHKYNSINSVTPQLITTQSINNGKPFIGTRVGTTVYSTPIPSTTTEVPKSTIILGVLRHNSSVSSNVNVKSSTNTVQSTTIRPRSTTTAKKPKTRIITSPTDTEKEVNIVGVSGRNSGLGSTTPRNVIRLSVSTNLNQNNNPSRNTQSGTSRKQSDRSGRYQNEYNQSGTGSTASNVNGNQDRTFNKNNNYQSGKNNNIQRNGAGGTTYKIEGTIYNNVNNQAVQSTLQPPFEYTTARHASTTRKLDHSTVYGTFSTIGSTKASKIDSQNNNFRPAVHINDIQSTLSPEFAQSTKGFASAGTTAAPAQFNFGTTASVLNAQTGNNKNGFYVTKTATPSPSTSDFKLSTSSSNYYGGTNGGSTNGGGTNGASTNGGFANFNFESRINNFDGSRTVKPRPFQPTSFGSSTLSSSTTQAPFTTPFYKISSASPFAVTRNEIGPTLPTTLATEAPSNSVYENVDNMINVLMEIANINGAKKEEETEDYSGETPRPGLVIPPSAGPQTLHTLATYFASALDDIVQERQKFGQEKLDKESLTNLLTEMTKNHYEELFKKNRQNGIDNRNNQDGSTSSGSNTSNASVSEQTANGPVNGASNETSVDGSSNKNVNTNIDLRSNFDTNDKDNEFQISVDDSINETLETGHSKNLVQSPEIRQLARNFSQALSSYLESPDDFRKQLETYRPTEPPPLETDNETGSDNEDELLNYSDADSKSSYPPIFPTSPSIPVPTWGYIFAFNNSYVKTDSLGAVNQQKDNGLKEDSTEKKANGDYEKNSLSPDLQSADSQSFIPRFNDVSSVTKATPSPAGKLTYSKSVTDSGNGGTSPSSPSSSGGPTYLPKHPTTPSSKKLAYGSLESSSVNPLANPLPDNHWTASPDATKLWQKTFSVNPVALNQHFGAGSVRYESTTEPLHSEERNTERNIIPEREIKYELRSLPRINLNSTQVHGILIDFMNSSVTDDNNRLQRILRKLNTSESEFLSRMKEIEGNPLTRRLILLLISECGADLAKEVRHLDETKLKDVEVFEPQPTTANKEEILAQRQEKLQQLLPPLNRGQKVVVTREEKSTRNHDFGRLVSPALEDDDQDARALQLLNSLYTIASRFGK